MKVINASIIGVNEVDYFDVAILFHWIIYSLIQCGISETFLVISISNVSFIANNNSKLTYDSTEE